MGNANNAVMISRIFVICTTVALPNAIRLKDRKQKCNSSHDWCENESCPAGFYKLSCDEGHWCIYHSTSCFCECYTDDCKNSNCPISASWNVVMYVSGVLAVPIVVLLYYYCCGGKRKRDRLMGRILSDRSQNQSAQNPDEMEALSRTNSNATSRSRSRSRSNSNIACDLLRLSMTQDFHSSTLPRGSSRHLRRSHNRSYGGESGPHLIAPDNVDYRHLTRCHGRYSAREYRRLRDIQVGGSLRIPSSHRYSRGEFSSQNAEFFRLIADAPPSYSDSCLHGQSAVSTISREDLIDSDPPPSYKEVVDQNYPLFGSFKEISVSQPIPQSVTSAEATQSPPSVSQSEQNTLSVAQNSPMTAVISPPVLNTTCTTAVTLHHSRPPPVTVCSVIMTSLPAVGAPPSALSTPPPTAVIITPPPEDSPAVRFTLDVPANYEADV